MQPVTYTARWLFPVAAAPIERGTITIDDDRIVAIGAGRAGVDLGNVAILPGFVNAHTHLDLSGARGQCPPGADFTEWLRRVIAFRRARSPAQVQADIAAGIAECLRFGTTLIGDIAAGGASWRLLAKAPCRATVFHEVLGLTRERARLSWNDVQQPGWRQPAADRLRAGISPHAPYSVCRDLYHWVARGPIATHLAETAEEILCLCLRRGPFVDFLKELNVWNPDGLFDSPLDIVRLYPDGIFVHGNFLPTSTPFTAGQTLVICPRTHAAFGHPHHPFPRMNVRVALGTDSLASNPDLDILAEARAVRASYPEVEPATILRMLTLNGAEALGMGALAGSLTPGKSADLVVLPLLDGKAADPHDLVLACERAVSGVMFRGAWITNPSAA